MTRSSMLAAMLVLCGVSNLLAAAPTVKSIRPANGARDVEASTAEIRIEFDQAMDRGGFSLCGGGPAFPRLAGKGRWVSDAVFVAPVFLEPGREYQFGVNCNSSRHFKNRAGEAAEMLAVRFKTAGEARELTREELNRFAWMRLKRAIAEEYSYRHRVAKDWSALFAAGEEAALKASGALEFATNAAAVLKAARDPHLGLRAGQRAVPTFAVNLQPNGNGGVLSRTIPSWTKRNNAVVSGRFEDGIGYIAIGTWEGNAEVFRAAHEALTEFGSAKGVIIDARFNAGGDDRHAQEFAVRFAKERAIFGKHRVRDPNGEAGWLPVWERVIEPDRAPAQRFAGKVAALMGPRCFSSNETFLLMMRHGAKARLFGERSYGSSGNPQAIDLGNGVVAMVPSWEAMDANGKVFEGAGIEPDVEVKFERESGKDAVLEAALEWLRK